MAALTLVAIDMVKTSHNVFVQQTVEQSMSWLQIQLFGPYFSSFSTNSYSYYSQMSQNLVSNIQIFTSALIVRQAAREIASLSMTKPLVNKHCNI